MNSDNLGQALQQTVVDSRLARSGAIALERIAMGGGETCWYVLDKGSSIMAIASLLRPGSCLSIYFKDQLRSAENIIDLGVGVTKVLGVHKECIVAMRHGVSHTMETQFVSGPNDLSMLIQEIDSADITFFYGPFPGRANDENAITLVLPDADGVTRKHPY